MKIISAVVKLTTLTHVDESTGSTKLKPSKKSLKNGKLDHSDFLEKNSCLPKTIILFGDVKFLELLELNSSPVVIDINFLESRKHEKIYVFYNALHASPVFPS